MSTTPAFVVRSGHLEPTKDLQEDLGLYEGAKLYLVSSTARQLIFGREPADIPITATMTTEEYMAGWNRMCGILKDGIDTSEERKKETEWELEHDRQKFGDD